MRELAGRIAGHLKRSDAALGIVALAGSILAGGILSILFLELVRLGALLSIGLEADALPIPLADAGGFRAGRERPGVC